MEKAVRVVLSGLSGLNGSQKVFDSQQAALPPGAAPIPCFRCGLCCISRRPLLSDEDVDRMAAGLGMTRQAFFQRYAEAHPSRPGAYIFKKRSGDCPFLVRQGREALCSIYAFKPDACRAWEASLWKEECRQGLIQMFGAQALARPWELFPADAELEEFLAALSLAPEGASRDLSS